MSAAPIDTPSGGAIESLSLEIGGMTCASCAMRVEKKLNKLEGVHATVNYATEQARVDAPRDLAVEDLIRAVESAGYTAAVPRPDDEPDHSDEPDELRTLRHRLAGSVVLSVPVIVLAMIPALQFDAWQWLSNVRFQMAPAFGWP